MYSSVRSLYDVGKFALVTLGVTVSSLLPFSAQSKEAKVHPDVKSLAQKVYSKKELPKMFNPSIVIPVLQSLEGEDSEVLNQLDVNKLRQEIVDAKKKARIHYASFTDKEGLLYQIEYTDGYDFRKANEEADSTDILELRVGKCLKKEKVDLGCKWGVKFIDQHLDGEFDVGWDTIGMYGDNFPEQYRELAQSFNYHTPFKTRSGTSLSKKTREAATKAYLKLIKNINEQAIPKSKN